MIVHNKKSAPVGLKFGASEDGKVGPVDLTLAPGENFLTDEQAKQWGEAKKHKMVKLHLDEGHLIEGATTAAIEKKADKIEDEKEDEKAAAAKKAAAGKK